MSPSHSSLASETHAACAHCPASASRRAFLGAAADAVAAALLAVAVSPAVVAALGRPLQPAPASAVKGAERIYPIPDHDGATIDEQNEVILVRWQGSVYAFALACPHQNTALRWRGDDAVFQCPKHKSRYRPDGSFIEGRATRSMDRFAIRRQGDSVAVNLDVLLESTQHRDEWSHAVVSVDVPQQP